MRLLVTGGCGFVGSNFVRYVLQHYGPEMITNVDALKATGNLANLAGIAESYGERYEFLNADIIDADKIDALLMAHQFFGIINFAAESPADPGLDETGDFLPTNVTGTATLLDRARHHGVRRFVQVSTDKVYGSLEPDGRSRETSPLRPNSPFAASKASADLLALSAHRTYGQEVVIVRGSNNYGPWQHPGKLIPRTIINALRDQPVPIHGDGANVRDWMHVDDHCAAIFDALLNGQPGEIYNLGAGNERQILDVVHPILEHLGKSRDLIQFLPARSGLDHRYALDTTKAHEQLDWKPRHRYEPALRETIDWYVRHRTWWEPLVAR